MAGHEIEYYFEDLAVGDVFEFGSHRFTEEGIVRFAERYDPQRFHVDAEAAAGTMFDGLVASGLHTLCVTCRMAVDRLFARTAVMGGIGFDEIRYPEPVRPGDEFSGHVEVVRAEPTDRHPDGGYVDFEIVGEKANGGTAVTLVDLALVERRDP